MRTVSLALLVLLLVAPVAAAPVRDVDAPAWNVASWSGLPAGRTTLAPADLAGRVVVILAFSGRPEVDEAAALKQTAALAIEHTGDREVAFVGMHTVVGGKPPSSVDAARAACTKAGLSIPIGHDVGGRGFAAPYRIESTPWTVMLDGRGVVRYSGSFKGADPIRKRIDAWRPSTQRGGRIVGQPFGDETGLRWLTPDAEPVRFEDHTLTLVRWWTDDCPHCAASIPALATIWNRYKDRGLHMLAVYHPKRPRPTSDRGVKAYARRLGFDGDMAYDRSWTKLKDLMGRARFRSATSVSFLVDRTGTVVWANPGPRLHWTDSPRWKQADDDIRDLERRLTLWLPPAP